jgi:hypothetical protein
MGSAGIEHRSARPPMASGVSLLGALVALAFGVRIAAAMSRTTFGRCVLEGSCDGLLDAALGSPGPTLLAFVVVAASSVPLVLWLRSARSNAQRFAELSDLTRKVVGYFTAAFAVIVGSFLALEVTAWWSISASLAIWMLGFAIVSVSFRGVRQAQVIYVLAVLGFPVLLLWLLDAPVV